MNTQLTVNVIGATGLVGSQLVQLLLENDVFQKVRIFVRRSSGTRHPKLEEQIVDFDNKETWAPYLNGDILFSALGTTLKQAGSKENEYKVDFTFNLNFARAAKENGINNYVLISSIGANAKSPFFYTRMKGELDEAVAKLNFEKLSILRPSSLTGNRRESRLTEKISVPVLIFITRFMLKKYSPIKDITVAKAMINAALKSDDEKSIWEADEIFDLAGEK